MSWEFRTLQESDEAAFWEAKKNWVPIPDFTFFFGFEDGMSYQQYLELLRKVAKGEGLNPGWVPATALFAFVGGEIVARLSLRHTLNDFLRKIGGHIGYGVMPAHRRKGYASRMLKESLPIAKKLGLDRVLVTCDNENVGSFKTIEAAGGVLEKEIEQEAGKPPKRHYWIALERALLR